MTVVTVAVAAAAAGGEEAAELDSELWLLGCLSLLDVLVILQHACDVMLCCQSNHLEQVDLAAS